MSTALEAEDLTKRNRRQSALNECTLEIPEGHVVGLVGPNGSGKTTLLSLAAGLITPTSGSIRVLGARTAESLAQFERAGREPRAFVRQPLE